MQIKHRINGTILWENPNIANLRYADLSNADLSYTNIRYADLSYTNLSNTNLSNANLRYADLSNANLNNANLSNANLSNANLSNADLSNADLSNIQGLVKIMGVEPGNIYWKAIDEHLINNNYQFKLGINTLRENEVFAADERVLCSYPGFHFASKSWCKLNYHDRPYLCKIRVAMDAKINEPWATDGKASADKIEILAVYDMETEKDVTKQFQNSETTNKNKNNK